MIIGVNTKTMIIAGIIAACIISIEIFGKIMGLKTVMKIVGGVTNKVRKEI